MRRARRTATIVSRILPTQSGHDRYPYRQGDCRSFSVTRASWPVKGKCLNGKQGLGATSQTSDVGQHVSRWQRSGVELYRANVTECIVARLIRFERPLIGPRGDRNGSITPVHHLQELSLAPLPTSVVATVSANGCSGEWDPVRPRISTVCSTLHPVVASVGFRGRGSQEWPVTEVQAVNRAAGDSAQRPPRREGRLPATEPPVGASVPMGVNDPSGSTGPRKADVAAARLSRGYRPLRTVLRDLRRRGWTHTGSPCVAVRG